MNSKKYISRGSNGWQFRMKHPDNATTLTRWFPDNAFGGKNKALRSAKTHRDQTLKEHNIPLSDGRITGPRSNSARNSSGIIGVSLRGDVWKGHYHDKEADKQLNKQFSTERHGECKAFESACQYRFDMCGTLQVYRGFSFPCEIPVDYEYVK